MRYLLALALVLVIAPMSAMADSSWYRIKTDGTVEAEPSTSASPGRAYKTTIDSTGNSDVIVTLGCLDLNIKGDTVSTNYTPMICESDACNQSSPCRSGGTAAVDEGCQEKSAPAVQIVSATASDVIILTCGVK